MVTSLSPVCAAVLMASASALSDFQGCFVKMGYCHAASPRPLLSLILLYGFGIGAKLAVTERFHPCKFRLECR